VSNQDTNKYLGIKGWSEEDRPREKMALQGEQALTNAELIAILLGSGTKQLSAVDVARNLLHSADNNLHELGRFSIHQFTEQPGIGEARAITISAALELGRRRKNADRGYKPQVKSSDTVYEHVYPYFADRNHEEFYLLLLDRSNRIVSEHKISKGGVSGTVVDSKIIFKIALDNLASNIILCHNHPSGNKYPSDADKSLTHKLKEAAQYLDIKLLDHLIFTDDGYYSFADDNQL